MGGGEQEEQAVHAVCKNGECLTMLELRMQ
jgi:hypothetical protein